MWFQESHAEVEQLRSALQEKEEVEGFAEDIPLILEEKEAEDLTARLFERRKTEMMVYTRARTQTE